MSNTVAVQYLDDRHRWVAIPSATEQDAIKAAIARSELQDVPTCPGRAVNVVSMTQTNVATKTKRPLRLFVTAPLTAVMNAMWFFEDDFGDMSYSSFLSFQLNARAQLCSLSGVFNVCDDDGMAFKIDMWAMTQTNVVSCRSRRIACSSLAVCSDPLAIADDEDEDIDDDVPDELRCPITTLIFKNPVIASDGHTYERHAIQKWLLKKHTSPLHGAPMAPTILPDVEMKRKVDEYRSS